MSASNKILQAAAGNAAGEAVYVEDVFSSTVYAGSASGQMIETGVALGDTNYGSSVEFDGVDDYLSRSSGLSSHANSNTFTLSIWVFNETPSGFARIFGIKNSSGSNNVLYLQISSSNALSLATLTDGASTIQAIDDSQGYTVPANQWSHILVSANTSTSTWHLSINDSYSSVTPQKPLGYTDAVAFSTSSGSTVGTLYSGYFKGRITQLYLDNTFRDLSQSSVRRTFITSDGTPATGLASLNPILYLPLDDTNSIGTNSGTGGSYTVNSNPRQLSVGGPYKESGVGKGGLLWLKSRDNTYNHSLFDTERPINKHLASNSSSAAATDSWLTSLDSNGFTFATGNNIQNLNGADHVAWTFCKQEGFFDIVKYTGNGTAGHTISHNLGSVPGMIIVKRTGSAKDWWVYHVGSNNGNSPENKYQILNGGPHAEADSTTAWNDTAPTATEFTLGTSTNVNADGEEHIAYLFANNDQSFGDDSDEAIIKCGHFSTNANGEATVDVGFEPQWLMIKRHNNSTGANWTVIDNMRGFYAGEQSSIRLYWNTTAVEGNQNLNLTSTGFDGDGFYTNSAYLYTAIRRPMKALETASDLISVVARDGTGSNPTTVDCGFPADMIIYSERKEGYNPYGFRIQDRFRGKRVLELFNANADANFVDDPFDGPTGTVEWNSNSYHINDSGASYVFYTFRRSAKFFDMVHYTGNEVSGRTIAHSLGVTPEFMMAKSDNIGSTWATYDFSSGATKYMELDSDAAAGASTTMWNDTAPTASVFTVGNSDRTNGPSYYTHIVYLFATVAGVSKVGSYSGTGSNVNVDCGFSSGARLAIIKRTDSTGDWYVFDSERGIVAGNDPFLVINDVNDAEVTTTDYIDPLSSGFTITSSAPAGLNANGGTYIFLAFA